MIDIYGNHWPNYMSIENSRSDCVNTKIKILKNYDISLCFENTNIPNYTSEKLWDAIANYTLPIYYAHNTIYNIFPKNSFIDFNEFQSIEDLYNFIQNLDDDEYNERLNKCINVFVQHKKYDNYHLKYKKRDSNIINKLNEIIKKK